MFSYPSSSSTNSIDEEIIILQQMIEDLNTEDDENAVILHNEMLRHEAIFNIHSLETTEIKMRRMKNRQREVANAKLWKDYFAQDCVYSPHDFRRRFRMRRSLFDRILEAVTNYDPYFVQRADAVNRLGLSPHQKIVAALRLLAYGCCADMLDETLAIGESTALQALKRFCYVVVKVFGPEYLRAPTTADVERITNENAERGFPGMLGSIDCMHWAWKNCPVAWQGSYRGHKGVPTIILEAVASYDTWIWSSFFGMPGCNNDLNVLHRSTVFEDLLRGKTPQIEYVINGHTYKMGYYLADGIYPNYANIVKSKKRSETIKEQVFSQAQESVRKDVERAFGILQSRFAFVRQPGKLWNEKALDCVMTCCIILHNMIVEDERRTNWPCEYDQVDDIPVLEQSPTLIFNEYMSRRTNMTDAGMHQQLRNDLVEHIWLIHSQSAPAP